LEAVVGVRSRMTSADRALLDSHATWPIRLVREQGRVIGLLMPLIPDAFVQTGRSITGSALRKEREIQYLFLAAQRCAKLGFPLVNLHQRFALCEKLARVFAVLHQNQVVFGDFNAKNALFSVGPGRLDAAIMLVDCDAVRVKGTMSAVPQLNTPDWEPPAAERTQLTNYTDVYKYSLFVLRTLSPGTNASTARDTRRVSTVLDEAGRHLLAASLSETPQHRPTAAHWATYFAGLRQSAGARPAGHGSGSAPAAPTSAARPTQTSGPGQTAGAPSQTGGGSAGWVRKPDGSWGRHRP
jgi:DNA-binding helix-hairpin-helix protein with protein kinase domain